MEEETLNSQGYDQCHHADQIDRRSASGLCTKPNRSDLYAQRIFNSH
jgi:hypothetical protein